MAKLKVTPQVLRTLVRYEQATGELFWLPREARWFRNGFHTAEHDARAWNARYAGRPALNQKTALGYLAGQIFGQSFKAHRVAWAIMMGRWPNEIDHINGDRSDNRWSNLRSVSRADNTRNAAIGANNTSGIKGVSQCASRERWRARISRSGQRIHLGWFATLEEAAAARAAAELEFGFHPNHGRAPTYPPQKGTN